MDVPHPPALAMSDWTAPASPRQTSGAPTHDDLLTPGEEGSHRIEPTARGGGWFEGARRISDRKRQVGGCFPRILPPPRFQAHNVGGARHGWHLVSRGRGLVDSVRWRLLRKRERG